MPSTYTHQIIYTLVYLDIHFIIIDLLFYLSFVPSKRMFPTLVLHISHYHKGLRYIPALLYSAYIFPFPYFTKLTSILTLEASLPALLQVLIVSL